MRIYDGENLKDTDPKAKSIQEYRELAGVTEGMTGISTRFAFKVLAETLNYDTEEIAADPGASDVCARTGDQARAVAQGNRGQYLDFIKSEIAPRYAEFIGREIQKAYIESYSEYGQNLFDRYIAYADAWIEEQDFKDPDTGQVFDRQILDAELSQDRKAGGHRQSEGFPQRGGQVCPAGPGQQHGKNPAWNSYEKIREVIEKRMFSQVEDLLPIISFGTKKDTKTDLQHAGVSWSA